MKTHYDPFYNSFDEDYYNENGYCGTLLNEDYYNATNLKYEVNCKKCIKIFERADKEMKMHSDNFSNDFKSFNDFIEAESKP